MSSLMLKYVWLFEYVCLCHCVRVGERYWRAGFAGHCGGFDGHSNLIQLPFCLYTCAHAACTGSVCLSGRVVLMQTVCQINEPQMKVKFVLKCLQSNT